MNRLIKVNKITEWLLELMGFKIWPPRNDNPMIKGPPPRIPRIVPKRYCEEMPEATKGDNLRIDQ